MPVLSALRALVLVSGFSACLTAGAMRTSRRRAANGASNWSRMQLILRLRGVAQALLSDYKLTQPPPLSSARIPASRQGAPYSRDCPSPRPLGAGLRRRGIRTCELGGSCAYERRAAAVRIGLSACYACRVPVILLDAFCGSVLFSVPARKGFGSFAKANPWLLPSVNSTPASSNAR